MRDSFIGIDISENDFYACFNELDKPFKFKNNHVGITDFINTLKNKKYSKKSTLIGVESTASYHLPLTYLSTQKGYQIKIINSMITCQKRKTSIRGVKNDPVDASNCQILGSYAKQSENRMLSI